MFQAEKTQTTHKPKNYPQSLTHFLVMSFIKMMKENRTFFNNVHCLENSVEDNMSTLPLFQKAVVSQ